METELKIPTTMRRDAHCPSHSHLQGPPGWPNCKLHLCSSHTTESILHSPWNYSCLYKSI